MTVAITPMGAALAPLKRRTDEGVGAQRSPHFTTIVLLSATDFSSAVDDVMLSVPCTVHGFACILMLLATVSSIPIDNGVIGEPVIECGSETITVSFKAQNSFFGRMFVKGFSHDEESCVKNGVGEEEGMFLLRFDRCGMKRSREISGVSVSATVIISFHRIFLTKVDRAYRISCFYMEAGKSVSQEIEVSMLTTSLIEKQSEMPVCRYQILRGGIDGAPVAYAKIGEPVYHKWSCEAKVEDQYCMRVHTCSVGDGQGGSTVPVLDQNGCEVDHFILQNLEYSSDLMAGQEAHVFKFADRPALYFNCQIELRVKDGVTGCSLVQPNCVGGASPSAVPHMMVSHSVDDTTVAAYTSELESGSTTAPAQPTETPLPFDDLSTISSTMSEQETLIPDQNKEAGNLRSYLSKTDGSICLSAQRFAGLAIALLGLTSLSIALILVGFVRRRVLYEAFLSKAKQ
uniref:ZP domain-containing protein n=2 Tax=Plectus sambesii TaxID=2011161 RepID=A0A914VUB9_9BILA